MMQKKSILFIHPFFPYPMRSGGHQALFNGIKAVAKDYDVSLVFEGQDGLEMQKNIRGFLTQIPNVHLIPLLHSVPSANITERMSLFRKIYLRVKRYCLKLHNLINGIEKKSTKNIIQNDRTAWWKETVTPTNREWINHISKVTHERHFDIIQIEMPWLISEIFAMPSNSKVIHVHHELGFARRDLEIRGMSQEPYNLVCKQYCDFNEIAQLNLYDAVITLSQIDANKLKDKGITIPIYSSFAVVESRDEKCSMSCDCKRLTFIGPSSHTPNFVGITWFLENCWTQLKQIDSSYSLDIIGLWDDITIAAYSTKYSDVHFLGFVEDLYTNIKNSIMIIPITIGSGIRMKILEAASKGIPFVSTTIGAEGIPVQDGKHCFLADDPLVFVDDIIKLQNETLRNQFITASREMFEENYSLAALNRNRIEIYESILRS